MLVQMHMPDSRETATPTKPLDRVRRSARYLAAAIVAFFIVFGAAMFFVSRTPDDRHVDAQLAAMRQRMAEKRRQTVAAIADRIVDSPMGRRAQEELLRSADEEVAGTNP